MQASSGLIPPASGIKGESGGGGFAAGAALYARDRQGPKFAFQHLIYPMIDDRTAVRKDLHPYVGEFVWTQANNYFGWRSLLGGSRDHPTSRLMRPLHERPMCRACRQPAFRSAVLISSSKKT
jgi:acetyl esterase/lipase